MMTREIIDAYTLVHPDGVERWTIMTRREDGELWPYIIPAATFQNLAVEYGLDPENIDELLRIALLQFHAPDPWHNPDPEHDPAAQEGHVRGGLPVRLDNADSTEQARAAHLERIAWTERNVVRFIYPQPGGERQQVEALARVAGRVTSQEVEVDPHERLQALTNTYRPDRAEMAKTRDHLRRALGREV